MFNLLGTVLHLQATVMLIQSYVANKTLIHTFFKELIVVDVSFLT